MSNALIVDKAGLARKLANKPKSFIVWELLQNALDEKTTEIHITARMLPGKPECHIVVEDDSPEGFSDMSSIYTMFKDSKKAPDPTKRGRFEIGEKLVVALAKRMVVTTTKGCVEFDGDTRKNRRDKTEAGSKIEVWVKMTRPEFDEVCSAIERFLPHETEAFVYFNGKRLEPRPALGMVNTALPTVVSDENGNLKRTQRKADVIVYPVGADEQGTIYEMGIPVMDSGDKWHYDVRQRVPVNWERNSVPPAFLRNVRTAVVESLYDKLNDEDVTKGWVQGTLAHLEPEAVRAVIKKRFGDKVVIADPSDPEGTKLAASQGYTVVHGAAFDKDTWNSIRTAGAMQPAGQVTPSPKPYNPESQDEEKLMSEADWSPDIQSRVNFAKRLAKRLMGCELNVRITMDFGVGWSANFGKFNSRVAHMALNYRSLGKRWFALPHHDPEVLRLLIHEFGHWYSSDHLSREYHDALCKLGAKLANAVLEDGRELFGGQLREDFVENNPRSNVEIPAV